MTKRANFYAGYDVIEVAPGCNGLGVPLSAPPTIRDVLKAWTRPRRQKNPKV